MTFLTVTTMHFHQGGEIKGFMRVMDNLRDDWTPPYLEINEFLPQGADPPFL